MRKLLILILLLFSLGSSDFYTNVKVNMDYRHGMYTQIGYMYDNYDGPDFVNHVIYYIDSANVHPKLGFIFPFGKKFTLTPMLGVKYNIYGGGYLSGTAQLNMDLHFKRWNFQGWNEYTRELHDGFQCFEYRYDFLYKVNPKFKLGVQAESFVKENGGTSIPVERSMLGLGTVAKIAFDEYMNFSVFYGVDLDDEFELISRYSLLYSF